MSAEVSASDRSGDPLRLGIVGCGSVSEAYMLEIAKLQCAGRVRLVAICDTDVERLERARGTHQPVRTATAFQAITEAPDIDVVLVLTSMEHHASIARSALEAGKHVLVEKPLAITMTDAQDLVRTAEDSTGYLVCAPHVTLSPTFAAIGSRLQRGDIGRVVSARGLYGWAGPDWAGWFYGPAGGSIFDLGVYNIASLTGLLGPVREVVAMTGVATPRRAVAGGVVEVESEDNAHILLHFGDAVFASVATGFNMQKYRRPGLELYGTEGTIQLLGDDWAPRGYEMWQNDVGAWQIFGETAPNWPWTFGLEYLLDCIGQGLRPTGSPIHALHVLEVMLKAKESGRTGRMQTIESRFERQAFAGGVSAPEWHRVHDDTRAHAT